MSAEQLDRAEEIVDSRVANDLVWAGALGPGDYLRAETLLERAERARVAARVRFSHVIREITWELRRRVWVVVEDGGPDVAGPVSGEVVRADFTETVAVLADGLRSHRFVVAGAESISEVRPSTVQGRLSETVAAPLIGSIDLRADPMRGKHGLIRLFARVRNTTEPLTVIQESHEATAFSMIGCHLILSIDRGKFLTSLDAPAFAAGYLAQCESVGTVPTVVDGVGKVLLSAGLASPGRSLS